MGGYLRCVVINIQQRQHVACNYGKCLWLNGRLSGDGEGGDEEHFTEVMESWAE